MPFEYWRWQMARTFGWTLEQVDALSVADLAEWLQVSDGMSKGEHSLLRKHGN